MKPLNIGKIQLEQPFLLAPMAGVTDKVFRSLCRQMGCPLTYTEMVSAKGMQHMGKNTYRLLDTEGEPHPCGVQLFGKEPDILARQSGSEGLQYFDVIDINMGCPAPKIVKNGEGSALMRSPDLADQIIRACVQATDKPVTVKFRAGWDEQSKNAVEFAQMAESAGAAAVTVHGRTAAQGYSGYADWNIIRAVKQAVHIPVIGNGDVNSAEDAFRMLRETGCDGVMIARGARGNPWIFAEITEYTKGYVPPDIHERCRVMLAHMTGMAAYKSERTVVQEMRKHIAWYLKGLKGASEMRQTIYRAESMAELEQMIDALANER